MFGSTSGSFGSFSCSSGFSESLFSGSCCSFSFSSGLFSGLASLRGLCSSGFCGFSCNCCCVCCLFGSAYLLFASLVNLFFISTNEHTMLQNLQQPVNKQKMVIHLFDFARKTYMISTSALTSKVILAFFNGRVSPLNHEQRKQENSACYS